MAICISDYGARCALSLLKKESVVRARVGCEDRYQRGLKGICWLRVKGHSERVVMMKAGDRRRSDERVKCHAVDPGGASSIISVISASPNFFRLLPSWISSSNSLVPSPIKTHKNSRY